jgi:hypothetical protein
MLLITTDPLVGYLALSTKSYGNAEASHEAIQCNLTARKGTVESPYSRYLYTTCSTWTSKHLKAYAKPYCDNHSLLIPHSSGYQLIKLVPYMIPDHDVTMTLSALRAKLTFRLASLNVPAHQDGHCDFNLLPRPAQLNVRADALASEALEELRAAGQPTEFYPSPEYRAYLRDGIGHITSCEKKDAQERILKVRNQSVPPIAQRLDRTHTRLHQLDCISSSNLCNHESGPHICYKIQP